MSHSLIIVLLICLAIFVGTLEQARIVLRQKTFPNPGSALAARRNTLQGDLNALALGIKQVQAYIDALQADREAAVVAARTKSQISLDKAKDLHKQVSESLDKADTDTALKICDLKIDTGRFHVRQARALVEPLQRTTDGDDPEDDS